jgi:hypothetical protein
VLFFLFLSFFFFAILGFELRAYTFSHSITPVLYCFFNFKIGFFELFAQAGFELPSFWSLPLELLRLQAWATGTHLSLCFWVIISPFCKLIYYTCILWFSLFSIFYFLYSYVHTMIGSLLTPTPLWFSYRPVVMSFFLFFGNTGVWTPGPHT